MKQLNICSMPDTARSSLARQIVRYLRNTLMSKLGGEQTELLQISADERARAARTALLFGEEEITRNLQIMLRTFDDLNYRQEQRFHLELGLMKLVHAQRLLPLEELLSGVAGGAPVRSGGSSAPRTTSAPTRTLSPAQATPPAPRSPFGFSAGSQPVMQTAAPVSESRAAVAAPPQPTPRVEIPKVPAAATIPQVPKPPVGFGETFTNGVSAEANLAEITPINVAGARTESPSPDSVQQAVVSALAQQGHATASQLISTARFTLEATNLRIEVPGMGKKMLALTVNAAAEKIIKQEVQRLGGPARFMVVPGEGVAAHFDRRCAHCRQHSGSRARTSNGAKGEGNL